MSLRRFLCTTLILLGATTGNLAFGTEKPPDKETKATQQPKKPTLRLVQAGGVLPKAAVASKAGMVVLKPDLVLTGPFDVKWKWGNVVIDCHWQVKNAGHAVAGVSKLRIDSSGIPSRCLNGQYDKTVPSLSPGSSWQFYWGYNETCTTKATLDFLAQVSESDENNNVYMIE